MLPAERAPRDAVDAELIKDIAAAMTSPSQMHPNASNIFRGIVDQIWDQSRQRRQWKLDLKVGAWASPAAATETSNRQREHIVPASLVAKEILRRAEAGVLTVSFIQKVMEIPLALVTAEEVDHINAALNHEMPGPVDWELTGDAWDRQCWSRYIQLAEKHPDLDPSGFRQWKPSDPTASPVTWRA